MPGSPRFSIEKTDSFGRSFKKLAKTQGKQFLERVAHALEELIMNPYPLKAREEPLPARMKLQEGWTFHKLEIWTGKGASGQIRLMYLVNERKSVIKPFWIYSHEQFAKRPADKDLIAVIQEALDEPPTNPDS
jgi:mRNA-degrading endonuclease RelE of RelBE toxin-antitoxin system